MCGSCQERLEKALTEEDHQRLLRAVTEAVHSEGLGFSPELISNLSRLQKRLASVSTPYRVVVDGLNVSRISSKNFSVMQVHLCWPDCCLGYWECCCLGDGHCEPADQYSGWTSTGGC